MKNLIQSIIVIICTLSAFNVNAQVVNDTEGIKNQGLTLNLGMGESIFGPRFYYADATQLFRLHEFVSLDSKATFKATQEEESSRLIGLQVFSGFRIYTSNESNDARLFINAQLGAGVLFSHGLDTSLENQDTQDLDAVFLPDYSLGVGVNFKNKIQLTFSTESLSFIGKIGYTF